MRKVLAFTYAIVLASLASCGPRPVDGLPFVDATGIARSVLADNPEGATNLDAGRPSVRYLMDGAIASKAGLDLAIVVDTDASFVISIFSAANDRESLATWTFDFSVSGFREYRMPLAPGITFQAMELSIQDGTFAEIRKLAIKPSFIGFDAKGAEGVPVLSKGIIPRYEEASLPVELRLPSPEIADWYLSVRVGTRSKVTIGARQSFAADLIADRPLSLAAEALGGGPITITAPSGIARVALVPGSVAPVSDLHAILAIPAGRSPYALYRWDLLPDTLVFDFIDYDTQDLYLKRLAFFAEKPDFKGRLAPDSRIASLHAWNAHDYPPWTLAAFFELARTTLFPLNQQERELQDLLVRFGILERGADGSLREGRGGIISISRESASWLRRSFMDHEASHALFFQDSAYRELTTRLWKSQGAESRWFWLTHLGWRTYDTRDEYLVINELQAYLVQQSTEEARAYYRDNVTPRLEAAYPDLKERFEASQGLVLDRIDADARMLDDYLRASWNLRAGSFGRVRAVP